MSVQIEPGALNTSVASFLYDNIFNYGTVTVSSETADGSGLNALNDFTFDFWTPEVVGGSITVDYGSAVECDTVGISAHDAGTNGSTIIVQSSSDGVSWTTQTTITPLTDDTILSMFPIIMARYWRLVVNGDTCSIGVIKLGKRLVMQSGVLSGHVGVNHARRVDVMTNESIKGHFLGNRIIRMGAEFNINLGLVDTDFAEDNLGVFENRFNEGYTFFYSGDAVNYPNDYGYCWRSGGELNPSYEEGGELMQYDMDVSCYVE